MEAFVKNLYEILEVQLHSVCPEQNVVRGYNIKAEMVEDSIKEVAWPTEKHFTSWLRLAPMKSSSGKMSKRVVMKRQNKAGQLFRNLAQGILTSKHLALGVFGRNIRARRGSGVAIKAIARKIACYYYRVMTKGELFFALGTAAYEQHL